MTRRREGPRLGIICVGKQRAAGQLSSGQSGGLGDCISEAWMSDRTKLRYETAVFST